MKVILTIAVRNPEWYWSKEQLKEAGDYRKEWEAINEDKIYKHVPSEQMQIAFDVKNIQEDRQSSFEMKFSTEDKSRMISHTINDVTIIKFIGENHGEVAEALVSNSIIHQYIGAKQKEYKYYIYFYLKENVEYQRLNPSTWISREHKIEIENALDIQLESE